MKNVIAMELITLFYQHQIKLGYKLKSCKGQQHILLEFLAWRWKYKREDFEQA